jgi:hypothetical protein
MVVSLRNHLSRVLNQNVPVTLAFERPAIADLTDWLAENQAQAEPNLPLQAAPSHPSPDLQGGLPQPWPNEPEIDSSLDGQEPISAAKNLLDDIDRLLGDL